MAIAYEIVQEFKDRMHLGDYEDDNLERILSASNQALQRMCGNYDIEKDEVFKELVFERSRYVYNDALEHFDTNFIGQITNLSLGKALEGIVLEEDANATE